MFSQLTDMPIQAVNLGDRFINQGKPDFSGFMGQGNVAEANCSFSSFNGCPGLAKLCLKLGQFYRS